MSRFLPPVTDGLVLAILPFARSLLDYSGAGRDPVQDAVGLKWTRRNGVELLMGGGVDFLEVADDATIQAITDQSWCISGDIQRVFGTEYIFSKHDGGGDQVRLYAATDGVGRLRLYDGVSTKNFDLDLANRRSVGVSLVSGGTAKGYADGAYEDDFSGASTITADDAPITLFNRYTGGNPLTWGVSALLWYDRALTADEFSRNHAYGESLRSPLLPHDRRYFDMGSLVPNGPQTQYGPTSDELIIDGDMEAAGTAAWTAGNSAALAKEAGSPGGSGSQVLRVTYNAVANPDARQTLATDPTYRLRGWARGDGGNGIPVLFAGPGALWTGTNSTTWVYFDLVFVQSGGSLLRLRNQSGAAGWAEFDNVSVVETNNLMSDGDMEATGTQAYTAGNSATLTKETGTPYEGDQVLRVAYSVAPNPFASQDIMVIGKKYRITGVARGDGTENPRVRTPVSVLWTGTVSTAWQFFDLEVVADDDTLMLQAEAAGAGYAEFDSILVREVFETIGAWDLGRSTGRTEPDKSGNGNDAALVGPCMPAVTEMGRTLCFDGATGQVQLTSDVVLNLDTGATIEWFAKIPGATQVGVFGRGSSHLFSYLVMSTTAISFETDTNGDTASEPYIRDEEWHHYAVSCSGLVLTFYVDGEPIGTDTVLNAAVTFNRFGVRGAATNPFVGNMGFLKLHGRALSAAEIKAAYQPIRDKLLYQLDLSQVPPTLVDVTAGQVIPGTDYTVDGGVFSVVELSALSKAILCGTAGIYKRPGSADAGSWYFSLEKTGAGNTIQYMFAGAVSGGASAAGQEGYSVSINSDERVVLLESAAGVTTTKMQTAAGYVAIGTRYDFAVTRKGAVITVYIKGGVYTDWTIASPSLGTNPYTDPTPRSGAKHASVEMDAGDIHFADEQYQGVIAP